MSDDAPRDGNDHLFEMKYKVAAYWDDELQLWVLARPISVEHLPSTATYLGPVDADALGGDEHWTAHDCRPSEG